MTKKEENRNDIAKADQHLEDRGQEQKQRGRGGGGKLEDELERKQR